MHPSHIRRYRTSGPTGTTCGSSSSDRPATDEIVVVEDLDADGRIVALYREGERLAGVLTVNGQTEIMKYRGQIMKGAAFTDAIDFAGKRKAARAAKLAATAS